MQTFFSPSVSPCEVRPCRNGGRCTETSDGMFNCKCPKNFEGILCERKGKTKYIVLISVYNFLFGRVQYCFSLLKPTTDKGCQCRLVTTPIVRKLQFVNVDNFFSLSHDVMATFQSGQQNEENLSMTKYTFQKIYFLYFFKNSFTVLPCDRNPCKNGGKCTNDGDTCFKCACPSGFKGKDCSKKGKDILW